VSAPEEGIDAAVAAVERAAAAVSDSPAGTAGAHERFLTALAERLAVAVAAVTVVLDPGCVVLGGELGRAGGAALASRVQLRHETLSPLPTEVRAATVTGSPVLGGALLTALDAARRELFDAAGAAAQA
jgi:predicted NBD/HSP70 family sugar kinase